VFLCYNILKNESPEGVIIALDFNNNTLKSVLLNSLITLINNLKEKKNIEYLMYIGIGKDIERLEKNIEKEIFYVKEVLESNNLLTNTKKEELRKKVDAYILRRELQPFEEIVEEENITEEILMVPIKKKKLEPLFTPIFEIKE